MLTEEQIKTRMKELELDLENQEDKGSTRAWMMRILLEEYHKYVLGDQQK